jgi:two-component system chemotaxis response regulator CheY
MTQSLTSPKPVTVSLDVVWQGSAGKEDARLSEISMEECFIDSRVQGRALGDIVEFKVHLPEGPWISLSGELVLEDYPIGFGLRFDALTDSDRRLLAQVIIAHGGNPIESVAPDPVSSDKQPMVDKPQSRRILVADDDPLTLHIVAGICESAGYTAIQAPDGREALRLLQENPHFHAAIFDMKMPYLQGLEVILLMKADEKLKRIPISMITAEQDPKVWDDSVAAGVSVFLPKPFTPPQVQMMLRILEHAGKQNQSVSYVQVDRINQGGGIQRAP